MNRIILAADGLALSDCMDLAFRLKDRAYAIKIHNLYDRYGPKVVQDLAILGEGKLLIWVDAKLHDTPTTVALRTKALTRNGANIITVHAMGEVEMMETAVRATNGIAEIYAVTILTSISPEQILRRFGKTTEEVVLDLALDAKKAGVQGIVCSPLEVGILSPRSELKGLKLVVPGIRSAGKEAHDQKRFDTPTAAIKAGATHLVIGRQITQAPDPVAALDEIEREISAGL